MNNLPRSLIPIANFLARHSALIALALFAAVGLAVLDDYGVSIDDGWQRQIGYAAFNYILGDQSAALDAADHNRFYGIAFELPLIAAERALGLTDSRHVRLSRRLITHAFFLAAGFFASLLAYRLFASRIVALFAMLLFLLHPRIYAHSFFNTKDLPFLCMFMVALYLIHRAFRRDSVWAFALCGAGAAAAANIRIFGVMLFAAVLGMLALDALRALRRGKGINRVLANAASFALASLAAFYATFPLAWRDPLALADALPTLARHPAAIPTLFRGETVQWPNLPWDFIPTWALITTPTVALILAALGIFAVARLCAARWRDALANSTARFGLLALACLTLPIAAVIAISPNMYNDWRMMYFLYAPLCVLAAFGLRALADIPKPSVRAAAFALTALGIAVIIVRMVSLHPYQSEYFSPPTAQTSPADDWRIDYWQISCRESLERALAMQPTGHISVNSPYCTESALNINRSILPADDRRRMSINRAFPDFWIGATAENPDWQREIYGVPIAATRDARSESQAAYQALYAAAQAGEPLFSGRFDLYLAERFLIYIREPCAESDTRGTFAASARPVHPDAVAGYTRLDDNFARKEFAFRNYGAFVDGADACLMALPLPTYPLESLAVSYAPPDGEGGASAWSAEIPANAHLAAYARAMQSQPAATAGGFAIYADQDALTYVKTDCAESDARGRFTLSAFPMDPDDLSKAARDAGLNYEYADFDFHRYGGMFGGKCVIVRDLPDFPISHLHAGQWIPEEGENSLWSAKIALNPAYYDRFAQALANLPSEPSATSGGFAIYADDRTLTYVKTDCAESDARGRFFLSVFPIDPRDLPPSARESGPERQSLNFDFHLYGEIIDGVCVIIRDLPDYPISHLETGQWIPEEGEGALWSAKIVLSAAYYDRFAQALANLPSQPSARADFDVYADDRTLIYVKTDCAQDDAHGRFFLSVFPKDPRDLPQSARAAGFGHEPLNFDFAAYGATLGDDCVIIRDLPDYPISHVETGQWIPGERELWRARIAIDD